MTTRHYAKGRGLDACYHGLLGMPGYWHIYYLVQMYVYTTSLYMSRMRYGSFTPLLRTEL
jgi:hypothetical protein